MRFSILALALAILATLAATKDHIRNHLKSHHHNLKEDPPTPPEWPKVIIPFNFLYDVKTFKLDPVSNNLTREDELDYVQYTDTEHN